MQTVTHKGRYRIFGANDASGDTYVERYDEIVANTKDEFGAMGVLLLVLGGTSGSSVTMDAPDFLLPQMPQLLRELADKLEARVKPN